MRIGVLSFLFVIVFVSSFLNAIDLRRVLNQSTQRYLQDVTTQMTNSIKETIRYKMVELTGVADSIASIRGHMNDAELVDFLDGKANIMQFDPLILFDTQGNFVFSEMDASLAAEIPLEDFFQMPSVQGSLRGEYHANYVGGQHIFYSVPVLENQRVRGVLIGVRSKENFQKMIASKSFDGDSLSCIIGSDGRVIISPTDLKPFLQIDDIFNDDSNKSTAAAINKMLENMADGQNGAMKFTAINGEELFLAYNSLGVSDWVLLTLIPADIIVRSVDRYVLRSFLIVGLTFLIFCIFLAVMYRSYNLHRRQLERSAFMDIVTGGLNNAGFQVKYRELVQSMEPFTYAIILLDFQGFKLINERFGSDIGNAMLRYFLNVMERHLDTTVELLARGELDHFFICMKEHDPAVIQSRLDGMIADINGFKDTDLPPCSVMFRQGACFVEDLKQDITILQDRARIACHDQSQDNVQYCVFYDESFNWKMKRERELNDLFEESMENDDFLVYLQPKIALKDDSLAGAEALVRWNHPQKGLIYPSDFIPLFERNGKICQLDLYMFEHVCKTLERWRKSGWGLIPISVNLSRQHFQDTDFLMCFSEIADRYDIPREMIEFELTESIFFTDQQIHVVEGCIRQMHALGFRCSLDDFGSGFSSLGLLKEFDVDALKLDRAFFLDLSGEKARDVVACLVELAEKLHVQTVAEGIETEDQLDYLRTIHCDLVQGYIFSKPLPIPEFEAWAGRLHS